MRIAAFEPVDELADGPCLIASKLEVGDEIEAVVDGGHGNPQSYYREKGEGRREKEVGIKNKN